jgi:hypothetical protein
MGGLQRTMAEVKIERNPDIYFGQRVQVISRGDF